MEQVKRGEQYSDISDSAIEISLPSVAGKDDKKNVEELLTAWAATQLESMVQAQLPDTKLEDLKVDGLRKLERIGKQTRTYKLTKAIEVTKRPQGQLAKIEKLVPPAELTNYFHLIDLNAVPYFHADVTVNPPNLKRLADRKVDRFVITQLSYAGEKLRDKDSKEISTIEYVISEPGKTANGPEASKLKGTFNKKAPKKDLEYSYLVAYADGTPSLQGSGALTNATKDDSKNPNYLDLSSVDLGALSVTLNSMDLPWDIISSAFVTLKYGDWEKRVTLKKDETATVSQPFGRKMDEEVSHQLTLNLTSGAPFIDSVRKRILTSGNADIILGNPLGDGTYALTVEFGAQVAKAQLRVEYTFKSTGANRIFTQVLQLDSAALNANEAVWKVPGFREIPSSFKVLKARVTTDAGTVSDLADLSGGTSAEITGDMHLTVLKDRLDLF